MRRSIPIITIALFVVIVGAAAYSVWAGRWTIPDNGPIDISVTPVAFNPEDNGQRVFGKLLYLGGMEISSPDTRFGGLSGLTVSGDGKQMLAVSDAGYWLSARLSYKGIFLDHMNDAAMGALLDPQGAPLAGREMIWKESADAESIVTLAPNEIIGEVIVSFERQHRMLRYNFADGGFDSRPTLLPAPEALSAGAPNGGLEAIEVWDTASDAPGLILIPEAGPEMGEDGDGHVTGWTATEGAFAPFRVQLSDGFQVTDAAVLRDFDGAPGDLLLLERSYSPVAGVAMRIRRIARDTIQPGAILDGEVLITADRAFAVDNMEGLAIRPGGPGEAILYVLSDDNYNVMQRTLLLQFAIIE